MRERLGPDFWRFVASFLVAAIHISPFEGINGDLDFFFTAVLGRVAVPLFLMITGYYVLHGALDDKKALIDHTKKIFKQYLLCVILYLPINIYMGDLKELEISNFLYFLKRFFTDGTFYHLWYFPALILGIWLSFLMIKFLGNRGALIVTAVLYLIGLFGDGYYGVIKGNEVISGFYGGIFSVFDYTRNGLFYTPVFLCLGHFVYNGKKSGRYDLMYCFLLFLLMTAEGMMLHYFGVQRHTSMYLFLVPLMFFVFRVIVNRNGGQNKMLRSLGTDIYILHPLVIVGVRFVSKVMGVQEVVAGDNLVLYILVCTVSFVLSLSVYTLRRKIGVKKYNPSK